MFAIVIDNEGYKMEFVVLGSNKKPQNYELKDNEKIVTEGWNIANSMVKPKWDGTKWIETGTPEPIPINQPTEYEVLKSEIDFGKMVRQSQQAEIDYLKLVGGV